MQPSQHAGFTLVEILVALAVVGLLAALAIPAYQNNVARAQVAEGLALTRNLRDAAVARYMETGAFPTSNAAAGLGAATGYRGRYVTSVELVNYSTSYIMGTIVLTYGGQAAPALQGRTLAMYALRLHGGVNWGCGKSVALFEGGTIQIFGGVYDTLDDRFKPDVCR